MAVDQPPTRAIDRGRLALAALFLYVIAAAMLLSLGGDRNEDASDAPAETGAATVEGALTHLVATPAEWQNAVAVASPGDVIRLTATIHEPLIYEGGDDGGAADGASGTAEAPIVITADPGVWIDPGAYETQGWAGLNIRYVSHVHVDGVQVRNAQYGIRCIQCSGSPEAPVRFVNNTITEVGYVGIHVGGHLDTHAPSSHLLLEGNSISNTGRLVARFGEGIYLGYGGQEWIDETSDIVVRNNEISHTSAEGIDIKPGTREIVIEGNRLHHVAPIDGGAISAHYVNGNLNPKPNELDRVIIRNNKIWNHNLNGAPGASDAAVWVGHGGVELVDNLVWGFRLHPNTRGVRVQAKADFGPHPIRITNNVFWAERGWVAEGSHAPTAIVESTGNIGPNAPGIEQVVTIGDFVGPVPPLGQGGEADAGAGPGSGLTTVNNAAVSATPPPTTAPPPPTTQPPPTQPPPTQPPPTQPPATQPPATQPPTTQPPATEPPTTQPPATEPPATQPPATEPPVTTSEPDSESTQQPAAGAAGSEPTADESSPATNSSDTTAPAAAPAGETSSDPAAIPTQPTAGPSDALAMTAPGPEASVPVNAAPGEGGSGQASSHAAAVAAAIGAEAAQRAGSPVFDHSGEWRTGSADQHQERAATEPGDIDLGLAGLDRPHEEGPELGPVAADGQPGDIGASDTVDPTADGIELSQARSVSDRSADRTDRWLVVFIVAVASGVAGVPIVQRRRLARR